MAKVAVTSTNGELIDEHFGRAGEFWIYEVNEQGEYRLLERRQLLAANTDSAAEDLHGQKVGLLLDVEVVLTAQIGPRAERELQQQGLLSLMVSGRIDKALEAYGKRGKFIRNNHLRHLAGGCATQCGHGSCGCCS